MKNIFRNSFSAVLFLAVLIGFNSCQKDTISPPNQSTAFVKYYGHVASQVAADLLRTSDGGYILLGGTNSYTSGDEKDIFVVKTDSLGNEMWSSSFGRANGIIPNMFKGDYIRFDEVGVRLAELPDGSMYTLACNRTYVVYPDNNSTIGTRGETKVVLYQIDATTGAPTTSDGVELHWETADTLTESVADMKLDSSSGVIKYVLTGYTTNVPTNKATVGNNDNSVSDRSDIFTVALDENFNITWTSGNQKYGRIGTDYGISVHVLDQNYLVCGTIDRNYAGIGSGGAATTYDPYSDMLAVFMDKVTGQPTNPNYYGEEGVNFRGGQSVYNPSTGMVTIVGYVEEILGRTNNNVGKLAMVKINEAGAVQSVNGLTLTYLDVGGRASQGSPFVSSSIAEIPDNEGYLVSSTYKEVPNAEHDICIIKVNQDFEMAENWPYFFGYNEVTGGGVFRTQETAGTVIPITEAIAGTSQSELTGYAFTGTFGLGTNDMIGLVKINTNGDFKPE